MHDLGDAMLRAGLAEPVMDVELYTLTYPDVGGLMRDLKAIGAHNVNAGRARGLTGRALERMTAAYEASVATDACPPPTRSCTVRHGLRWAVFDRPPRRGKPDSNQPDRPQGIT